MNPLSRILRSPGVITLALLISVVGTSSASMAAVVMTSITTAAGIGALVVSSLESSREFAVFTAFGVIAAMICSLTLLPALLSVLPLPRRRQLRP